MSLKISQEIEIKQKRKVGRNDPCPCGSGKKYKKCCLVKKQTAEVKKEESKLSVRKVVDWATSQPYFKEMLDATLEDVFGKDTSFEEDELSATVEALIYEGLHEGRTIFEAFIDKASLSKDEKMMYEKWRDKGIFSYFKVTNIDIGVGMMLKDMVEQKELFVYERLGTYGARVGMIITARIVPYEDGYMMTGGMNLACDYGEKTPEIENNFKKLGYYPSQTETLYGFMGKKSEDMEFENMEYGEVRDKLVLKLKRLGQSQKLEKLEKYTRGRQYKKYQDLIQGFTSNTPSEYESQQIIKLGQHFWSKHPSINNEPDLTGPKEKELLDKMFKVASKEGFELIEKRKRQKEFDKFVERWLEKPRKKFGFRTPKEVILEERKKLDNQNKDFKFKLHITTFDKESDLSIGYNNGVRLMKKEKYLEALNEFSDCIKRIDEVPDSFRLLSNVGVCLLMVGESDLAKKFYQKSLKMNKNYQQARRNLELFKDKEIVRQTLVQGKNRMFDEVLKDELNIACTGIKENEFLHDFNAFLNFIASNKVKVSPKWKVISKSIVKDINRNFTNPDPEVFEFHDRKGRKQKFHHNSEIQFQKVNFLHKVLLTSKVLSLSKNQLRLTDKGTVLLSMESSLQFGEFLRCWLLDADWEEIRKRPYEDQFAALNQTYEVSRGILFSMLEILYEKKKFLDIQSILADVLGKGKDGELARAMLPIFIDRDMLSILGWMQILKKPGPKKILGFLNMPLVPGKLRLTAFGKCFMDEILKKMEGKTPEVYKKF